MGDDLDSESVTNCKVVIIGAGMAGLSAASLFAKNEMMDFVVLEARNRIGGRIVGVERDNMKVELGANWIHGVLGNPMFELAVANNLVEIVSVPKPHRVVGATENGKQVPFSYLQEIYEAYMCFLHRCEEYFLCQYLPPQGIESVGEHIQLEIELYLSKVVDPMERHLRKSIFECLLKRETCISGCDSMNEIDLLELGSYTELQGGNITLPSGYSSILEPASRDIPKEKIRTGHVVAAVSWSGGDWRSGESDDGSDDSDRTVVEEPSSSTSGPTTVHITCENGSQFHADHVICTIPLGVLKEKANSIFSPPLPQYKQESIERLLFGTVDKIFLQFDRPFLNADVSEIMLLWDPSPTLEGDLSENWFKKIYSFSKVTETVLLGWISGREAEYMETLPSDVVMDKCTELLRKFLNDPFVPKPKTCICSSWKNQPYTRGSYTAMAVGASQCDIENLAQSLYGSSTDSKPRILFAGEHTHSSFYSTVHGAYLSGRNCAQALLDPQPALTVSCPDSTSDLSSWIRGISLTDSG